MKNLFLFLLICTITSCSNHDLIKGHHLVVENFPEKIQLIGNKVETINSIGINKLYVIDTFLLCFKASGLEEFFDVYSTQSMEYLGKCVSPGRGPNEFLSIQYNNQYIQDSTKIQMWIKDDATLKLALLNLTKSLKTQKTIIDSNIYLSALNYGCGFINKDILINISNEPPKTYLKTYNLKTDSIYPTITMFKDPYDNEDETMHNMMIEFKPDKQKFISAFRRFNQINIFSTKFTNILSISVYKPTISTRKVLQTSREDRIEFFSDIYATDTYFFTLYINQPKSTWDQHFDYIEIQKWDWEGNPILKFLISDNLIYFTVDRKHKCIYGLNSNEEIFKYDIKEYI